MDIKLKSSKKISFLVTGILVVLAAAGFLSLYPFFEKRADNYQAAEADRSEDDFLEAVYRGNYIFYKDFRDKADETNYSYEELYLELKEKSVTESKSGKSVNVGESSAIAELMRFDTEHFFDYWEERAVDELAQKVDYCVVDNQTGEMIKNTERPIELLAQNEMSAANTELPYVYYIKVAYDGAGNPEKVRVKGENPDELLKSVQRVMKSGMLEKELRYGGGYTVSYQMGNSGAVYVEESVDGDLKKITWELKAPRNVTFIYGLTEAQQELLTEGVLQEQNRHDQWYSYYYAGVAEVYGIILLILAILIFLCMHMKWYCLHQMKAVKIDIEFSILAGTFIAIAFGEALIELVCYTNGGYFNSFYKANLSFIPTEFYPALTGGINFISLCLLFVGWIYCVNTFGEVTELGIREFVGKRSLLGRISRRLFGFGRKSWKRFREELLHTDLRKETRHILLKVVIIHFIVLAVICSMWIFGWIILVLYSVGLYFILKKYIKRIQEQYDRLLEATGSIAKGNLHTTFDEDLGVFESYKEELYKIQEGFRKAVDEEVKSQRMKTELITNVSHDLKTPLTAITTYIDLLKEENITEEQRKEYITVLEKKSLRLKTLIEDLFEVSKANSRNVTVQLVDVDLGSLMRQVYLEYEDRAKEANLTFRFRMPEEKMILKLDSQKTYRIFENLYINIIKYAMPNTRVYIDVEKTEDMVNIECKNMSAVELAVDAEELTERFVRGDSSRNTEGSGLGLAIARSFTELQGGKMEVLVDGDLFKVILKFVL